MSPIISISLTILEALKHLKIRADQHKGDVSVIYELARRYFQFSIVKLSIQMTLFWKGVESCINYNTNQPPIDKIKTDLHIFNTNQTTKWDVMGLRKNHNYTTII